MSRLLKNFNLLHRKTYTSFASDRVGSVNTVWSFNYSTCKHFIFNLLILFSLITVSGFATSKSNAQAAFDLGISYLSINNDSPLAGTSMTLTTRVINIGDTDYTGDITILYYRSLNSTVDSGATPIDSITIASASLTNLSGNNVLSGGDISVTGATNDNQTTNQALNLTAENTAGTYFYYACVEAVSGEDLDDNNCSVNATPITVVDPQPDLVVSFLSASNATPTVGQTFTLTGQAKNTGQTSSSSTKITYYVSTDNSIGSDQVLGTTDVETLTKDGTSIKQSLSVVPTSTGTFYYYACVNNLSNESSTTNNCSSLLELSVIEGTTDLVISLFSASSSTPTQSEPLNLSSQIKNIGSVSASDITLTFYRSSDSIIDTNDAIQGSRTISSLSGTSSSSVLSVTTTTPSTAGNYYYGACVATSTTESDSTNNCSNGVLVRVNNQNLKPDLLISYIAVSDVTLNPGTSATISTEAKNSGLGVADSSNVIFFLSTDSTIDFSDSQLDSKSIDSLASFEQSSRLTTIATATTTLGTYYVGACVETVSNELSMTNNCSTGLKIEIEETPTFSDLIVSYFQISDVSLKPNSSFNLSAKAKNSGEDDAASSSALSYYLSEDANLDFSDTLIGSKTIDLLTAGDETSLQTQTTTAPANEGTYYYFACVNPVSNEKSTSNNCSNLLTITVDKDTDTPFTTTDPSTVTDGTILDDVDVDDLVDPEPDTDLEAPVITATINNLKALIDWDAVENATGYKLYYAPLFYQGESTIKSIDLGNKTSFTVDLNYGDAYLVAATAYNSSEESAYSNIEKVVINRATYSPISDISSTVLDPFTLYQGENSSNSEPLDFVNNLGLDFIDQIIMPNYPDLFFAYFSALTDDIESLDTVSESLPTVMLSCYANQSRDWVLPMIIYHPSGNEDNNNNLGAFRMDAEFDFKNVLSSADESTDKLIYSFETSYNTFGEPTIFKVANVYVLVPKAHYMFLEDANDHTQALSSVTRSEDNSLFPSDLGIIVSSVQDAVIEFELKFNTSDSNYTVLNNKCTFEMD